MLDSIRKDAIFDKCPKCNAIGALRRSRARTFIETLVKNSGILNIYRCRECGWRGTKTYFSLRKISIKTVFMYIAMLAFVAVLIRFIILRFIIK
jgi:predicted RNA-binding Zn-ribbon protein involved in translation (DUF1610 family)